MEIFFSDNSNTGSSSSESLPPASIRANGVLYEKTRIYHCSLDEAQNNVKKDFPLLRIEKTYSTTECIVVLYRCHFYEKVGYERCCERYKLTENVTGMCTLFENRDCHRHLKTPTHELRPETTVSEVLPTIITPEVFCRKKLEKKCKPSEIRTKLRERSKYC